MTKRLLHALVFSGALTLLPVVPAVFLPRQEANPAVENRIGATETTVSTEVREIVEKPDAARTCYRVYRCATGEIEEIPVREYVLGAVAAEMPVSFEPEALKAQAVAAHTYAERQCLAAAGREELQGADFSDDPAKFQAFLTEDELRERWGTHYDCYREKLSTAVDEVVEELLTYEDEPIIAAFHAMSTGRTESAANVWGSEVAYLQPADSPADENAPQYEEQVRFSPDKTGDLLRSTHPALDLSGEPSGWFGVPSCSDSGTVLSIPVADGLFTGQELRSLFDLRSAAFTVTFEDGAFVFTTHGFGHDVGMSQYGANAMALEGKSYREILAHYYTGAELVEE
ncbi:MAG: stage II sporulation protein D [Oscillospiraceae bacterium]|nr:stage II sporulation protein D [Oscillospiraceae bacterium]